MNKAKMMMGIGITTGLICGIMAPMVNGTNDSSDPSKSLTNISVEKSDSFENCSGVLLTTIEC